MAVSYRYKAQNTDGKIITGELRAADEAELQGTLKNEGLFLVDSKELAGQKTIQ